MATQQLAGNELYTAQLGRESDYWSSTLDEPGIDPATRARASQGARETLDAAVGARGYADFQAWRSGMRRHIPIGEVV
jgi:hypothetical protein